MSIGEPVCVGKSYSHQFGSITLGPSNPNWSGAINLTRETLPEDSIVRSVSVMGVSPSAYKSMSFRNEFVPWKDITLSGFDTNCTQQYKLRQEWQIRYVGGTRDRRVTPKITLYYTYPMTVKNSEFWR